MPKDIQIVRNGYSLIHPAVFGGRSYLHTSWRARSRKPHRKRTAACNNSIIQRIRPLKIRFNSKVAFVRKGINHAARTHFAFSTQSDTQHDEPFVLLLCFSRPWSGQNVRNGNGASWASEHIAFRVGRVMVNLNFGIFSEREENIAVQMVENEMKISAFYVWTNMWCVKRGCDDDGWLVVLQMASI